MSDKEVRNLLSLDVGSRRIGLATANTIAKIATPLTTLNNDEKLWDEIAGIVGEHSVNEVIVGLPRSLEGDDTDQTRQIRDFADELRSRLPVGMPIHLQDEALTSQEAELILRQSKRKAADVDSMAAAIIMEDFLNGEEV